MNRKYFSAAINIVLALVLVVSSVPALAERWSYVYIQGDKQIPFYVKLEGEMLPRYSKNYCIIPELEAGPIHIEILFQQNQFPAQRFTILVPDNGSRGFLLTRKDNSFALYDIQQHFYLLPGEAGEDHLPEMIAVTSNKTSKKQEVAPESSLSKPPKREERAAASTKKPKKTAVKQQSQEPQFLDNVVLNNDHSVQSPPPEPVQEAPAAAAKQAPVQQEPAEVPQTATQEPAEQERQQTEQPQETYNIAQENAVEESPAQPEPDPREAQVNLSANTAPIINSDCPQPLDDAAFDKLYSSARDKSDDERRVAYLMKKAESNCFSTRQVFFLARELKAESMRYSFLKKVYPRVTDQQNFHMLEDNLFRTLEWKSYFRLIQQ